MFEILPPTMLCTQRLCLHHWLKLWSFYLQLHTQLARQRAFLREERRKAREEAEAIQMEKKQIEIMKNTPPSALLNSSKDPFKPAKTLKFNIGGQIFETSETVLKRDGHSVLASLCDEASPLQLKDDGILYFDRDW